MLEIRKADPKILIIRMSSLGDIVLAAPVFRRIKSKWPNACVEILVKPRFLAAVSTNSFISAAIPFTGFLAALSAINSAHYDIIIDLHATLRSRLICLAARAPLKLRYRKASLARMLFVFLGIRTLALEKHTQQRYLDALAPLGLPQEDSGAGATADWPAAPGPTPLPAQIQAGVNTGAAWPTKRWPKEKWALLIRKLAGEYGGRVLLVGSQEEIQWNAQVENLAGQDCCFNLTGKTSISELIAAIRNLKVFISNDSGPLHIAAALDVPAVGIFGPTTRELGFFPRGLQSRVVQAQLNCRPCALHGAEHCPRGHFLCMNLLTVEEVFNAARGAIAERFKGKA